MSMAEGGHEAEKDRAQNTTLLHSVCDLRGGGGLAKLFDRANKCIWGAIFCYNFHRLSQQTVSKAFVRSTKVI